MGKVNGELNAPVYESGPIERMIADEIAAEVPLAAGCGSTEKPTDRATKKKEVRKLMR